MPGFKNIWIKKNLDSTACGFNSKRVEDTLYRCEGLGPEGRPTRLKVERFHMQRFDSMMAASGTALPL
jgi:hypothetical protein